MTRSKVFITLLTYVVSVLSQTVKAAPTPGVGDVAANFVGDNNEISRRVGESPDGKFFAPGVDVVNPVHVRPIFQHEAPVSSQIGVNEAIHLPFLHDSGAMFRAPLPMLRNAAEYIRMMRPPIDMESVREAANRFRSSPIVQLLPPTLGGSGSGGAEIQKLFGALLKPFVENNGKRYEPVLPEFPEIFLTDEEKDTCFAHIKKMFDDAYPKLPELVRTPLPISIPVPRKASRLPPNVLPNYVSLLDNGIVYTTYKVPTSRAPIYVPFEKKTMRLAFPAYPIYVPYTKLSADAPWQSNQYYPFIPFQPDRYRSPSQACDQSAVLMPIPEHPKEHFTVASYTLSDLRQRPGEKLHNDH
jgi:hypothetical protein